MTPIWGFKEIVVPYVAEIIGSRPDFGKCRTLAVFDSSNELAAGLIFNDWNPECGTICVSMAATSPKWATRRVMAAIAEYCYGQCGCQMVVARQSAENTRIRRLWRAVGAKEYIIPRLRGRNADEVISALTDDAWNKSKFNEVKNGSI